MKYIYICSPYAGDVKTNIEHARNYCKRVSMYFPGTIPLAPHLLFTQFLNDNDPTERGLGLDMGLGVLDICDELWTFGPASEGMKREIEYAKDHEIPVFDGAAMLTPSGASDAAERLREDPGDVIITLPFNGPSFDGVAAMESVTLRFNGEAVVEIARQLRRHPTQDLTVEAKEAKK